MEIHSPMDAVELSRIRAIGEKVQQLQKEGRDIVRLQIGEPDFTTPDHIIAAAKAAMDHGQTHYAPNRGLLSLREEISRKLLRDNGITADPATEILVTSGCAEGLYLVFMGLVEPGDEVIIIEPAYISYLQLARAAHAKAVPVHAREENGWMPDLDELRAAVTEKTKLLVLNTPGNPTGAVYPREVLQQIAALAQEKDFLVLSDEVYEKLIYDGAQHVSIASLDGMKERTITVNGFSKAFAMTGWRMGYLAADAKLILPMLKVHQYAVASSNIIAQNAAITALQAGEACVEEMRQEYARRRRFLLDSFAEIPEISCAEPAGTFYMYPNISGSGMSGTEFADRFLIEAGVATVPGTAFDSFCNSHIRISYASSMESLQMAVSRLKDFLKK
jgi:aminotransferase